MKEIGWLDEINPMLVVGGKIVDVYTKGENYYIVLDNGKMIVWENYRSYPEDWAIKVYEVGEDEG